MFELEKYIRSLDEHYSFLVFNVESPLRTFLESLFQKHSSLSLHDLYFSVQNLLKKIQLSVLILKPHKIISEEHIALLLHHVMKVFNQKSNITNSPELEVLLFLSSQRQIKKALSLYTFPLNQENLEIQEFTFILFGNSSNLEGFISTLTKIQNEHCLRFIPLKSFSKDDLLSFIDEQNLSYRLLHLYASFYHPLTFKEVKIEEIQTSIIQLDVKILQEIILDALNHYMNRLFLSNYKNQVL